ncbi:MAG TPA: histidine kinase, partial [Cyclobacteriaceae bacterium]
MSDQVRRLVLVAFISGGLGSLFLGYLHYSEKGTFPMLSQNISGWLLSIALGCISGFAAYYLNHLLDKLLPWKSGFAVRFSVGYVAQVVCLSVVLFGLSSFLLELGGTSVFWKGFSIRDEDLKWKLLILILVTSFIYKVIYTLLYSYKQFAVTQIESIQNERRQLELQFEALKSQLSPHYLFNSLNTISSLIYNDPQTAEQFIRRLALTYQYILATQHKKYVLLLDEVEFVQSYYYLLRIRFQQSLTLEINLPNSVMNSPIPPLTLQLLVENAVKHNTINPDKPLFIYISSVDNTELRVTNTKNESEQASASFRIGLENIRKRYQFFTNQKIEIKDDEKFMVSLPVIKLKQP